jgi:DNA repair exonuclease SbcCD ATPase subunit
MDRLKREAERMDLEKSITFDPQLRQIDQMVNGLNELPSMKSSAASVHSSPRLHSWKSPSVKPTRRSRIRRAFSRMLRMFRDAIAEQLDIEKDKASALKDAYSDIEGAIRDMESAINDFSSAADQALQKMKEAKELKDTRSTAEQLFDAGDLGDYEIPGGESLIGREGGLAEIEEFNKMLEDELAKLGRSGGWAIPSRSSRKSGMNCGVDSRTSLTSALAPSRMDSWASLTGRSGTLI